MNLKAIIEVLAAICAILFIAVSTIGYQTYLDTKYEPKINYDNSLTDIKKEGDDFFYKRSPLDAWQPITGEKEGEVRLYPLPATNSY